MVEKANSTMLPVTTQPPIGPSAASKAAMVSGAPISGAPWASTVPSTPEQAMTSP